MDRLLIVVAAPVEAEAVLRGLGDYGGGRGGGLWKLIETERHDVVVSGVGKANAAGATGRMVDEGRHAGVLSLGIGGSLVEGVVIGSVVLGTESVFADEGMESEEGFTDLESMGFGPGMGLEDSRVIGKGVRCDLSLDLVGSEVDLERGVIATVSTCSGTDGRAAVIRGRTGAICEAMEGAAVGLAARRCSSRVGFGEVRVISNTTGDRGRQVWDLRGALGVLERVASVL